MAGQVESCRIVDIEKGRRAAGPRTVRPGHFRVFDNPQELLETSHSFAFHGLLQSWQEAVMPDRESRLQFTGVVDDRSRRRRLNRPCMQDCGKIGR